MTDAGTPNYQTPAPKGGMPKWLIIVLIILGLIIFTCCGGFVTCTVLAKRAASTAATKLDEISKEMQKEVEKQAAEAKKRMDEEARKNAEGSGEEFGKATPPSASDRTESGGATPLPPSIPGEPAVKGMKLPANFPGDVPVYSGMQPMYATSDKIKDNGHVIFSGNGASDTVSSYYESEMVKQGWNEESKTSVKEGWVGIYSKDGRSATVSVTVENGKTVVSVIYEKKTE
jgi:hypothetical protein